MRLSAMTSALSYISILLQSSSVMPRSNRAVCSSCKGTISFPSARNWTPELTPLSSSICETSTSCSPIRFVAPRKLLGRADRAVRHTAQPTNHLLNQVQVFLAQHGFERHPGDVSP